MYLTFAKIQNQFCSSSGLGSLTAKPAAFEDAFPHPVASKDHIFNFNQLHKYEKLLITNQQRFFEVSNSIYNFSMGNRRSSDLPLEGNDFFCHKFARRKIYHYGVFREWGSCFCYQVRHILWQKKGKNLSQTEIIKCLLILIFNRSI